MAILVIILLVLTNVGTLILLIRAARRLLQFDDMLQRTWGVLAEYSVDLTDMAKGDLLLDSPEVIKFHKRNMNALYQISTIADEIGQVTPPRAKRDTKLPAPDVV